MLNKIQQILNSDLDFEKYSISELSRIFKCDNSYLNKQFKKLKIKVKNGNKDNSYLKNLQVRNQNIIQDIINGLTRQQLSNKYSLHMSHISKIASDNNLRIVKNSPLNLSGKEEQVIIGTILGDASITNDCERGNFNSRLDFKHSIKQKEYLSYKLSLLPNVVRNKEIKESDYQILKFKNRKKLTKHKYVTFRSYSNIYFTSLRKKWYLNKIKTVPKDLNLTPLVIAIWFMDDGTSNKYQICFCTNSFTIEDCKILVNQLLKFNIKSRIYTNSHKRNMIYLNSESILIFIKLILPYMHESMMYKLKKLNKWRINSELLEHPKDLLTTT